MGNNPLTLVNESFKPPISHVRVQNEKNGGREVVRLGNNPLTLVNTVKFSSKGRKQSPYNDVLFSNVGPPNKVGTTQEVNVWEWKRTRLLHKKEAQER